MNFKYSSLETHHKISSFFQPVFPQTPAHLRQFFFQLIRVKSEADEWSVCCSLKAELKHDTAADAAAAAPCCGSVGSGDWEMGGVRGGCCRVEGDSHWVNWGGGGAPRGCAEELSLGLGPCSLQTSNDWPFFEHLSHSLTISSAACGLFHLSLLNSSFA